MGHHSRKGNKGSFLDKILGSSNRHNRSRGKQVDSNYSEVDDRYSERQAAPQTLILCPSCREKNQEAANFCHQCGTSLNAQYQCKQCNAPLESAAKFCGECGTKQ